MFSWICKISCIFVVTAVSSDLCVEPLLRTKTFFFLLSTFTEELLSTPKIMIFLPQLPSGNKNCERALNSIP